MSQNVTYDKFCSHYRLNRESKQSEQQYKEYCDKLKIVNNAFAKSISNEALKNAAD